MIFIVLTLMSCAFLFGTRTLNALLSAEKIKNRSKVLIEIGFFLSWVSVFALFDMNFLIIFGLCIFWHVFLLILLWISDSAREKKFREEVEGFLDRTIFNLLAGNSFRSSCLASASSGDAFSQQEILKILNLVFFKPLVASPPLNSFARFVQNEVSSIDSHPHSALTRLRGLRRNLQLESEFRQKSEQIRGRIWIQAVFMLGLYLAVLIFVLQQKEPADLWSLLLSVSFFAIGFTWTLLDGRKMKWKT